MVSVSGSSIASCWCTYLILCQYQAINFLYRFWKLELFLIYSHDSYKFAFKCWSIHLVYYVYLYCLITYLLLSEYTDSSIFSSRSDILSSAWSISVVKLSNNFMWSHSFLCFAYFQYFSVKSFFQILFSLIALSSLQILSFR